MATNQAFWLMKSEPGSYSIDDLKRDGRTCWDGVRNYQARNLMRDEMKVGDLALFYHSSADPAGVAGLARVCQPAYPDPTAWDPKDGHYDPRSTPQNPVWLMVDVEFVEKFKDTVSLAALKAEKALDGLMVIKRGQRLSIQPVGQKHMRRILRMAGSGFAAHV